MKAQELTSNEEEDIDLSANVLPFIDVDGTLLDYDGPQIVYCDFLINWLLRQNIRRIVLLTNMNIREIYVTHPSRFDLIQYLSERGIEVIKVITPLDVTFVRLKITKKMGDLYSNYFSPIESCLSTVKKLCEKDAITQFINIFIHKLFGHLKNDQCYNFNSVLSTCLNEFNKTQVSTEQLTLLTALGKELFIYNIIYHTHKIDPKLANKGEAYLQFIEENPSLIEGRQIIFIDDTEKERVCVYNAHKLASLKNPLLVLPPPSDHKNQVSDTWERVHQHSSALQYVPYRQFSMSVTHLCRLSVFSNALKVTYTIDEISQLEVASSETYPESSPVTII